MANGYRKILYKQQNGLCFWCGKKCLDIKIFQHKKFSDVFTVDHVVPRARGGVKDLSNCVGACRGCNQKRNEIETKLIAAVRFDEFFKNQPLNLFPVAHPSEAKPSG